MDLRQKADMSEQTRFAEEPGLSRKRKKTKREHFLREMDPVVPWKHLVDMIAPCYPFLQQCYAYSIRTWKKRGIRFRYCTSL